MAERTPWMSVDAFKWMSVGEQIPLELEPDYIRWFRQEPLNHLRWFLQDTPPHERTNLSTTFKTKDDVADTEENTEEWFHLIE